MPSDLSKRSQETADYIKSRISKETNFQQPRAAVICGSGLGGLADTFETTVTIPYGDIPNFPESTVVGHASKLVYGLVGDNKVPAIAMVGRFHFYEGHAITTTTFPVRVFKKLGIEVMIATNAAGGLNEHYRVGDLVVLNDHLNLPGLVGQNPLFGPNDEEFGTRFPPLSDAYDLSLRQAFFAASRHPGSSLQRSIHEGVYAFVGGPTYETRAECRMLRMLGADLVGMSTVPEIVVARHCGIRVLGISLVTNEAVLAPVPSGKDEAQGQAGADAMTKGMANHEEVLEAGRAAALDMQACVASVVNGL